MSDNARVIVLTPPGRGAVATVRVEGGEAVEIVDWCFRPAGSKRLADAAIGAILFGRWLPPASGRRQPPDTEGAAATPGEEVVVCRRGDVCGEHRDGNTAVEIHCHGGEVAVRAIVDSLVHAGAREQAWQQWTADRAEDAIAAEAAIALAHARTARTAAILMDQWHGKLTREIARIGELLSADVPPGGDAIRVLLDWKDFGLHLTRPWRVVLAGRPNVGKSSLINALVGYERAIVFDQPGTTRDAVQAAAAIDGWPVELTDTAGLRCGAETLEAAGIARAREQLADADQVILVFDAAQPWSDEDANLLSEFPTAIAVYNKCDLPPGPGARPDGLCTSAVTREGLDDLIGRIAAALVPYAPPAGAAVPFTPRQFDLLQEALSACQRGEASAARRRLRRIAARPKTPTLKCDA